MKRPLLLRQPLTVVLSVIIITAVIRVLFAWSIGLGVDESYVVAVSRYVSLSYFDHPPLHFWLVRGMANLTGSENPVILRFPFIMLFAGTTWLMYKLGERLFNAQAGACAALLLNLSAVFSLSTGTWILPDGPLMFFMLATTVALANILFNPYSGSVWHWWLAAGLCLGLGMLSKYHAVFIGLGTFLYILSTRERRRLLITPWPYLAAGIALLVFIPVLIWNNDNSWVSLAFQAGRGAAKGGIYPAKMLANIGGQAAWVLPWIWLPLVWLFVKNLVAGPAASLRDYITDRTWFLCCLAVGPIVTFTIITLWGSQALFHWQAPGYLMLFPLLGRSVAIALDRHNGKMSWWLNGSIAVLVVIVVILGSHTATGWLKQAAPQAFKSGDPTVEALNWQQLRPALAERGLLTAHNQFIVAGNWIDAGKIDYALGGEVPVVCFSAEPHHFAFMYNHTDFTGQNALLIGRKNVLKDAENKYGPYFESLTQLESVTIYRGNSAELELVVYLGKNYRGNYQLPYGKTK